MRYYPVNLDIENKHCLVVGGGEVGTRKVLTLLRCRACITVVSPAVTEKLEELALKNIIQLKKRKYQSNDSKNMFLIISAANDRQINTQVNADALKINALCNIADMPEACNFTLPALVTRGDMTIAVSTSGKSPALSKKIRKKLEKIFGNEYAKCLEIMGAVRTKLLSKGHDPQSHKKLFRAVIDKGIISMLKKNDFEAVNLLLIEIFGKEYALELLMGKEKN